MFFDKKRKIKKRKNERNKYKGRAQRSKRRRCKFVLLFKCLKSKKSNIKLFTRGKWKIAGKIRDENSEKFYTAFSFHFDNMNAVFFLLFHRVCVCFSVRVFVCIKDKNSPTSLIAVKSFAVKHSFSIFSPYRK